MSARGDRVFAHEYSCDPITTLHAVRCCADEVGGTKAGGTKASLLGLYFIGHFSLAIYSRLGSVRECSCDRWEAAFKTLKDYLHTKGNYIWKESMPMVYKALLARSIEHEVNTPAHKRDNDRSSSVAIAVAAAFKDGSSDFSIGRSGSDWLFAMADVRDLGFIVAWLKWLVDYITHLGRDCYANCFTNHLDSVGTDGACAVTVHCTEEATRGARLYSTATADEWRMEKAQRIETARLLRKAGTDYPFPGWRSIDDMLAHV